MRVMLAGVLVTGACALSVRSAPPATGPALLADLSSPDPAARHAAVGRAVADPLADRAWIGAALRDRSTPPAARYALRDALARLPRDAPGDPPEVRDALAKLHEPHLRGIGSALELTSRLGLPGERAAARVASADPERAWAYVGWKMRSKRVLPMTCELDPVAHPELALMAEMFGTTARPHPMPNALLGETTVDRVEQLMAGSVIGDELRHKIVTRLRMGTRADAAPGEPDANWAARRRALRAAERVAGPIAGRLAPAPHGYREARLLEERVRLGIVDGLDEDAKHVGLAANDSRVELVRALVARDEAAVARALEGGDDAAAAFRIGADRAGLLGAAGRYDAAVAEARRAATRVIEAARLGPDAPDAWEALRFRREVAGVLLWTYLDARGRGDHAQATRDLAAAHGLLDVDAGEFARQSPLAGGSYPGYLPAEARRALYLDALDARAAGRAADLNACLDALLAGRVRFGQEYNVQAWAQLKPEQAKWARIVPEVTDVYFLLYEAGRPADAARFLDAEIKPLRDELMRWGDWAHWHTEGVKQRTTRIAWFLARTGADPIAAAEVAGTAVERFPADVAALDALAEATYRTGDAARARTLNERALRERPTCPHLLAQQARFAREPDPAHADRPVPNDFALLGLPAVAREQLERFDDLPTSDPLPPNAP